MSGSVKKVYEMKPEFDRETDALLRSHARRGGARAGGGELTFARGGLPSVGRDASSAHLDADELNAFAENAAPEAARSRYLSHLADCDDCRRTAARLTLAASVAVARGEPEVLKERAVSPWRARLAALLAPGAWRYAMPVVALLGVGVVALVLMKRAQLDNHVTTRQSEARLTNSNATEQEQHATGDAKQQPAQSPAQPPTSDAPAASNEAARHDAAAVANPRAAKTGGAGAPASPGAQTTGGGVAATSGAAQPEVAQRRMEDLPPPPAAGAPVPAPTPVPQPAPQEDALKAKDVAKSARDEEVAEKTEAQKSRRADPKRAASSEIAPPAARSLNRAALKQDDTSTADRAGGLRARQSESRAREEKKGRDAEPADNSPAETRKVAGRKFRRQGDSWIDAAYNSSQAATVVRRNSEQYRALVADEPEIGRIANALGGEVVVVWKGRAYRIR
jgi:hypothetical protein